MADSVTLSTAVRESLLSLQNTSQLIKQTQGRLASGLRVESAIDDPVSFFQAKSLSDRAFDFSERKDAIDQGISTVTAALDGVEGIEELVRQLKGVVNSMKSASSTQMSDLVTQFNDLRTQIDNLGTDAAFQGTNLIAGTGTTLTVEFSEKSASLLNINSVDISVATGGLQIGSAVAFTGQFVGDYGTGDVGAMNTGGHNVETGLSAGTISFTYEGGQNTFTTADSLLFTYGAEVVTVSVGGDNLLNKNDVINLTITTGTTTGFYINADDTLNLVYQANSASNQAGTAITAGEAFTLTYQGQTRTFTTANGPITFTLGGAAQVLTLGTAFGTAGLTITQGGDIVVNAFSAAAGADAATGFALALTQFAEDSGVISLAADNQTGTIVNGISASAVTADQGTNYINFVQAGDNTALNDVIDTLDSALITLRTKSQVLGTNVAVLQTRLDFTETYVNTLESGAAKLTLADLNEEGANLLALQTRQQLGIQALAFAGQAEQGILALFR